jgi:hypothetical protein
MKNLYKSSAAFDRLASFLGIIAIGAVIAAASTLAGCDNGSTGGGNSERGGKVEEGDLSGIVWERRYISTAGCGFDFTDTYSFTSGSNGKYTHKGWGGTDSGRQNYNEESDFTYIYDGAVNLVGVITVSGSSQKAFSMDLDYKTMTVSGQKYTRK